MRSSLWPSGAFEAQTERDAAVERIDGRIPPALEGCFYRIHDLGPDCAAGEPVFVPDPSRTAEDAGWVLSLAYDPTDHHSFLSILDAPSWTESARLHLPFHVPIGLHASFVPAAPA